MKKFHLLGLALVLAVSAMTGCHGKSSETDTVVSGMASKGPIKAGTVKVFAISGGAAM